MILKMKSESTQSSHISRSLEDVAKCAEGNGFFVSCPVSAMKPSIQDITAKSIDNQFTDINIPVQYLRTAKDQSRSLPSQLAANPMDINNMEYSLYFLHCKRSKSQQVD